MLLVLRKKKMLIFYCISSQAPRKCLWQYPDAAVEEEVMMGELCAEGCKQGEGSLPNHPSVTTRQEDGLVLVPVADPTLLTCFFRGQIQTQNL